MAGIIGGVTWLVGLVLIVVGAALSIADWNRKQRARRAPPGKPGDFVSEEAGAGEVLEGLAKLFDAIKGYETGRFLMALGFSLVVLGAIISTAGALGA